MNEKQKLKFYEDCIKFFFESEVDAILSSYQVDKKNIEIGCVDDANSLILEYYSSIMSREIIPVVDRQNQESLESQISLYKLLSVIEFAIVLSKPLLVLRDKSFLNYKSEAIDDKRLISLEKRINGYLAYFIARNFLANWDDEYLDIFKNNQRLQNELEKVEDVPQKEILLNLEIEHIYSLAYNRSSDVPIFTNATWWRMFCRMGFLLNSK